MKSWLGDELPKQREKLGKGLDGSGPGLRKGGHGRNHASQRGPEGWTVVASGAAGKTRDFTQKETAENDKP